MREKMPAITPSEEIPFQGRGIAFWRELFAELKKLRFDRRPTPVRSDPAFLSTHSDLADLYAAAAVWHGTGRYHYSAAGEVMDVLEGIARNRALVPHSDDWDVGRGPMHVTCAALSRMYARLYASMHYPQGKRISNELGSRELWGYYFFVTSCTIAIMEFRLGIKSVLRRDLAALMPDFPKKMRRWGKKISRSEISQKDAFVNGTDIPANYPILIGIRDGAFIPAEVSKFIALHERRAATRVLLDDITHMEVPAERVDETLDVLRRFGNDGIRVLPIEYGEEYCRSFSFRQLVSGKRLRR
jgi:hypothetical protein